jgi:hypothetical protein
VCITHYRLVCSVIALHESAPPVVIVYLAIIEYLYMSVGVMKDQKVKLRDLHTSHTLGYTGDWNT